MQMHILQILWCWSPFPTSLPPSLPPLKASPRGLPFSSWGYLSFCTRSPSPSPPPPSFVLIEFISAPLGPLLSKLRLVVALPCRVGRTLGDSPLCLSLWSLGNGAEHHRSAHPGPTAGLSRVSAVRSWSADDQEADIKALCRHKASLQSLQYEWFHCLWWSE